VAAAKKAIMPSVFDGSGNRHVERGSQPENTTSFDAGPCLQLG